jgi:hypothetical protein
MILGRALLRYGIVGSVEREERERERERERTGKHGYSIGSTSISRCSRCRSNSIFELNLFLMNLFRFVIRSELYEKGFIYIYSINE